MRVVVDMPRACSGTCLVSSGQVPRRVPSRDARVPSRRARVTPWRAARSCPVNSSRKADGMTEHTFNDHNERVALMELGAPWLVRAAEIAAIVLLVLLVCPPLLILLVVVAIP